MYAHVTLEPVALKCWMLLAGLLYGIPRFAANFPVGLDVEVVMIVDVGTEVVLVEDVMLDLLNVLEVDFNVELVDRLVVFDVEVIDVLVVVAGLLDLLRLVLDLRVELELVVTICLWWGAGLESPSMTNKLN